MPKHPCTLFLLTLISLCAVASATTPPNLAGYWPLDDALGSTQANDQTLTSNGVPNGNPVFGFAGVGTGSLAIDFDGNGDFLAIPHHNNYLLDSGTIVFWFKTNTLGARKGLLSKDSTGFDTGGHLSILLESNNKVSVRLQSTTTSYTIYSTTSVQANQWHHVAVVFGIGGMELYLDGVLESTNAYAGGMGTTSGGTGNFEPLVLGSNSWKSTDLLATPVNDYFNGLLDEVGILSERWSSATIADLYAQTGPGSSMNLGDFAAVPVFYVRTRGSDANNGLTPQTSFRTIQKAVNNCTRPGTTVYIGPGTYRESLRIGSGVSAGVVSGSESSPIRLVGDTQGTYTFDSPGEVLLDGQNSRQEGINHTSVIHWNLERVTLRNFTRFSIRMNSGSINILGCTIEVPQVYGIYSRATGDLTISDSTFERDARSGSISWIQPNNRANPVKITITRNDASMKNALYLSMGYQKGWLALRRRSRTNRYVYGFLVYGWGGGVDSIEITNNQISDCYLPIYALLLNSSGTLVISNNTMSGCMYGTYAIGYRAGVVTMMNNIVDKGYFGAFMYNYASQTPIYGGLLEHAITFDMTRYRRPFEASIISGDPLFTDAPAGDFSLTTGSPGIDAGLATNAPTTDIAGRSRPTDGDNDGLAQIDIGAYELVNERTRIKVVQWREISGHRNMSGK